MADRTPAHTANGASHGPAPSPAGAALPVAATPLDVPAVAPAGDGDELLSVRHLSVEFATREGWAEAVSDLSFDLRARRTLGLVGESGCGKSTSALAIMGLLPKQGSRVTGGEIRLQGEDLLALPPRQARRTRGSQVSMIFQEPMTSLNPAFTIGEQIAETARFHLGLSRKAAWRRAVEYLDLVEIPNAARRARDYPHTFSGGMLQRAMIAVALVCDPIVLVADEPTTALDVTIQAKVLALLQRLQADLGIAILLITHDLGVVAEICDDVTVMYAGQAIEQTDVAGLASRPGHPYTAGLLECMPQRTPGRSPLKVIPGAVPRPDRMPDGCRFHPRCVHATDECRAGEPLLVQRGPHRFDRCVRHDQILADGSSHVPA